jgi:IS4 transposase
MPETQAGGVRRVASTLQRCLVWDIELAFKRLKSLLHIDKLPTRTEAGGRSWVLAHLILALLTEDISQDFLDTPPLGTV